MPVKIKIDLDISSGMKEINRFIKNLEKLESESVDYGYFGGKVHVTEYDKSGNTEAYLMMILEMGSESANIPARPVFRRTGESMQDISNSKKLSTPLKKFLLAACDNKDKISSTLLEIGDILRKETQKNFGRANKIGLEPNRSKTIAKKGRNDPLVDTGSLRDSMGVRTSRGGKS